MYTYIQLEDGTNRVLSYMQLDEPLQYNEDIPNPNVWLEFDLPEERFSDYNDYLFVDGELVYSPLDRRVATAADVLAPIIEAKQEELLPLIPDEVIETMATWFPFWDGNAHSYAVGNIVNYEDVLYRCVQAHTSQQGWNPVDAASLWAKVLTDPDVPQPWEQPSSTNPYMKGDRVTHVGHTWVSDIDNNVWEPGVFGWTAED